MPSGDQLQARIAKHFPHAVKVGESALRIEKRSSHNRPFAICYFETDQRLPEDEKALTTYVDNLIGPNYFRGSKSLQWSNYLYFVTSNERLQTKEVSRIKEFIEADRRYARKFVISEDELDIVLSAPAPILKQGGKRSNVFSVWMSALAKAGLDGVILSDDDTPTRLSKIEMSLHQEPTEAPIIASQLDVPSFIQRLELVDYRPFPLKRNFDFGSVNLIVGPNATGKTSLLEAIELYYCGRNKRGGQRPTSYEIRIISPNGSVDVANGNRELAEFRNRNLNWYGQSEVKTHNIDQSFAKFNFLNADAAVNISDSMNEIEDVLSKLLIGPDASKVWHSMLRVKDALVAKVRELQRDITQAEEELAAIKAVGTVDVALQQNSDVLRSRLTELLNLQGWSSTEGDGDWLEDLYSTLSEFAASASQAASLGWVQSPITQQRLNEYCFIAERNLPLLEDACRTLEQIDDGLRSNALKLERDREILGLLTSARNFIESGLVRCHDEFAAVQAAMARDSGMQPNLEVSASDVQLIEEANASSSSVESMLSVSAEWVRQSNTDRDAARDEYHKFSKLRDDAFNLSQQLQQIANSILKQQSAKDVCPLCHTPFAEGELARHMAEGAHADLDKTAQMLLERVSKTELSAQKSSTFALLISRLYEFLERASLPASLTLSETLQRIGTFRESIRSAKIRLRELEQEIKSIEDRGFTLEDFRAVVDLLINHGVRFTGNSEDVARQIAE